jgi:tryptophan synthase alpha chain
VKIEEAFRRAPILIAYIAAGDPSAEATVEIASRLAASGADIIELGLPHSDPIADGPVIAAAAQRAIANGMNTDLYFLTASRIRDANPNTPLVFMGYYNMILRRGLDRFAKDCLDCGIKGLIVPDLPIEEGSPLKKACAKQGIDLIFLIAPNTPGGRMPLIIKESSGFIYLVARSGVTGARSDLQDSTKDLINRVPPGLPKGVGFGISTPEQAGGVVANGADAAIVGSACVDLISKGQIDRLEQLIREMKAAIIGAKAGARSG